jgi:hypothetical protein
MAWYPFSAGVSVRLALASASIVHSRGDSYF